MFDTWYLQLANLLAVYLSENDTKLSKSAVKKRLCFSRRYFFYEIYQHEKLAVFCAQRRFYKINTIFNPLVKKTVKMWHLMI